MSRLRQHCHILFHEDLGMMANFIINEHATPAACQHSYDKSLAGCDTNYPVDQKANCQCRKRARVADKVCRRQIPKK